VRPVVVIPTVFATLRLCRVNDGLPSCEAGVGDEFVQCGEEALFRRRDEGDAESWPVCALHRSLPGALL
jgi:hypothetical protein